MKALTLVVIVVPLALAVVLLAGGDHGPGRHYSLGIPSSSVSVGSV